VKCAALRATGGRQCDNPVVRSKNAVLLATIALGVAVLSACFEPRTQSCANGALCPAEQACTDTLVEGAPLCGAPDEVAACYGISEPELCSTASVPAGSCRGGICYPCRSEWAECRYAAWTPIAVGTEQPLQSVWLVSNREGYAVGNAGTVLSYDGDRWTTTIQGSHQYSGVWAGVGDTFIVDSAGNVRRNGEIVSGQPIPLARIWGRSPDDVVAVGGNPEVRGEFDGMTWSWDSTNPFSSKRYFDVWGVDTTVFAVGEELISVRRQGVWSGLIPPSSDTFRGVWAWSEHDFVVVGAAAQDTRGVIYRYVNGVWMADDLPPSTPSLNAVWGTGPDRIYAVGSEATILHYDGAGWSRMDTPTAGKLHDIDGTSTDAYVVGEAGLVWRLAL
jgi:hypothetical protein